MEALDQVTWTFNRPGVAGAAFYIPREPIDSNKAVLSLVLNMLIQKLNITLS